MAGKLDELPAGMDGGASMTEERTGYTTRDVTTLSNAQLIEEAL